MSGNDAFVADGAGLFDMQLSFAVSGGGLTRRLNAGESFSLDFAGIAGLQAESFSFPSVPVGAAESQLIAVQVAGIGASESDGWHTVPEPTSTTILISGLGYVAFGRCRTRHAPRAID